MFKLAIEVCFKIYFGLIHAILVSLESTNSVYLFRTPDALPDSSPSPTNKGCPWRNITIDDCAKDGGEELFTEMRCVL